MFHRTISIFLLVAAVVCVGSLASTTAQDSQPPIPAELTEYKISTPSDDETVMLEFINRARANPPAEGQRLVDAVTANFPNGDSGTDLHLLLSDFQSYPARPPLAFNALLNASAQAHVADMEATGELRHNSSDGTGYGARIQSFGYAQPHGENCAGTPGTTPSIRPLLPYIPPWATHGEYLIDPGVPSLGHRLAIMEPTLVGAMEIGISHYFKAGWDTEDFGANGTPPLLTGVVFTDNAGTGFYASGEGVSSVIVTAPGASTYYAVTVPSGAYTLPLDLVPVYQQNGYYDPATRTYIQPPPRSEQPPTVAVVFTDTLGKAATKLVTLTHTVGTDGASTYCDAQANRRYDNAKADWVLPASAGPTPTPTPDPTPTPSPAIPTSVTIAPVPEGVGFIVSRSGDLRSALTVTYTAQGTAIAGRDYSSLSGIRKIKAGKGQARVKVTVLPGATGSLKLKLVGTDAYGVGSPSQAKVRLAAPVTN